MAGFKSFFGLSIFEFGDLALTSDFFSSLFLRLTDLPALASGLAILFTFSFLAPFFGDWGSYYGDEG